MRIRTAGIEDWPRIWPLWHEVVAAGDTYAWLPDTPYDRARSLWMQPPPAVVYLVEDGPAVVASAVLKPNQTGLGDHVANASFMVRPDRAGRGIGRSLASHVLDEARAAGYQAMQFNAVVETNTGAVNLWISLGFRILCTVPEAFRHAKLGPVGLHIMYREL